MKKERAFNQGSTISLKNTKGRKSRPWIKNPKKKKKGRGSIILKKKPAATGTPERVQKKAKERKGAKPQRGSPES